MAAGLAGNIGIQGDLVARSSGRLSARKESNALATARAAAAVLGPPSARSNGSGSSPWREIRSQFEDDYQFSLMPPVEPDVTLSLAVIDQLKEDIARELRKIVREELRPLVEASRAQPAPATQERVVPASAGAELQAEPPTSVGQPTAMALSGSPEKQGPPGVSVPATSRSADRAVPSAHDGADAPPARGTSGGAARVRAAGAQAGGGARAAGLDDKANEGSPEQSVGTDIRDQLQAIKHLTRRMSRPPKAETDGLNAEAWALVLGSVPCCSSCLMAIRGAWRLLGNVEAPPRSDPLSRFVDGKKFDTIVHIVILLNVVFIHYDADLEISNCAGIWRTCVDTPEVVVIGELFFLIAYSIEFVAKIWRYRWYYFCDSNWKFNCVDCLLLTISALSVILEGVLPNLSWLRMVRMLRLLKVIRVLELVSFVRPLRVILRSLFETLGTLFWSVTLLFMILQVFSLVFVTRVTAYLQNEGDSVDERVKESLLTSFGTVRGTFHNLFEVTFNGNNWPVYYAPLKETGPVNSGVFYFFVVFTQIAVLNVILGVFVDAAMKSMVGNRDERIQEHAEEQQKMADELMQLCVEADADNDGKLSQAEWQACMTNHKLMRYLEVLGWRENEAHDFLNLMCKDTADGSIGIDVFVRACMRFNGAASCYDMQIVLNAVEDLRRYIRIAVREGEWREVPPGQMAS